MSPELTQQIHAAMVEAIEDEAVSQQIIDAGLAVITSTPEEFVERIKADSAFYAALLESTNLQVD